MSQQMPDNPSILITLEEAAARCGCCTGTVRRRAARGELRLVRLGPRCVRLNGIEVAAFAERQRLATGVAEPEARQ